MDHPKLTAHEDAVTNAPVSIREVAAYAGVSVGTVSNVLNRPDVVAEPTRSRVQAAIKQLGFIRNESARQLRAGRSRTVGLIVLDVANPFFTDVARGVEDEASESGLAVILCNSDDQQTKETHYLELLEEHRVQGILITPVSGAYERLARLQRRGTPVVLLDSRSPTRGQCSVSVDDVLGGDIAVTHLLGARHERIAFVGGPMTIRQVADRREGAVRALERSGLRGDQLQVIVTAALNVPAGKLAGAEIAGMPAGRRPTAVFCANDLLALGVLQEMTASRIRVPDSISIVGYDDIDFAAAAAVPLSSVRQPRHLLGRTAAQLLLEEALGAASHQHRQVVFEPELVIRQSSRTRQRHARHGKTRAARVRPAKAQPAMTPAATPAAASATKAPPTATPASTPATKAPPTATPASAPATKAPPATVSPAADHRDHDLTAHLTAPKP
jgi:LacI family transcriptional regulator